MKIVNRAALAVFCLSAGAAWAQAQSDKPAQVAGERRAPELSKLDRDGDGALSRVEARARQQLLVDFERIDLDRDDRLEPAEYASFYSAGYRASK